MLTADHDDRVVPSHTLKYAATLYEKEFESSEPVRTGAKLLDMLRFHKFTVGASWISEYGNPDQPKDFEFIYKYAKMHPQQTNPLLFRVEQNAGHGIGKPSAKVRHGNKDATLDGLHYAIRPHLESRQPAAFYRRFNNGRAPRSSPAMVRPRAPCQQRQRLQNQLQSRRNRRVTKSAAEATKDGLFAQ
ncbi:hypothetical protein ANCCEY_04040 [Ancylostoma ceylanicum]|uniref:Peptidase S9 prolyl oligopeptidase catalytic domain-containing protein n=1 Tax=Ancylostoma ceylanicum TaxID=53326 RepID=A0A0D6LYL8_9BILA|nr:hypothetical protein ANCCEY_04040 [Ancylostoma ceylanicum]